jgi:tRNA G18 (ribose-2'-O)-methylase SpoU
MTKELIGVGPSKKPWPTDPKYDPELLKNGDKRNVLDKYRYWTVEAIKADLDNSRVSLHVAIENWQHDLNIGTIVRAANAFNVETVHIIGKRHWNRRGAMVTDRYMNIVHHKTVEDFADCMKTSKRQIIAFDIVSGAIALSKVHLPAKAVFVFGGEGPGLSEQMQQVAEKTVKIEQFGSTRSVNVGVAAGIAMYVWLQQNILEEKKEEKKRRKVRPFQND